VDRGSDFTLTRGRPQVTALEPVWTATPCTNRHPRDSANDSPAPLLLLLLLLLWFNPDEDSHRTGLNHGDTENTDRMGRTEWTVDPRSGAKVIDGESGSNLQRETSNAQRLNVSRRAFHVERSAWGAGFNPQDATFADTRSNVRCLLVQRTVLRTKVRAPGGIRQQRSASPSAVSPASPCFSFSAFRLLSICLPRIAAALILGAGLCRRVRAPGLHHGTCSWLWAGSPDPAFWTWSKATIAARIDVRIVAVNKSGS